MIANLIYITSLMEGIVRLLYAETVHFFLLLLEAASRYTASHERRRGATTTGIWGEGGCWAVVKHVNNHTHCTKSAHTHTRAQHHSYKHAHLTQTEKSFLHPKSSLKIANESFRSISVRFVSFLTLRVVAQRT